MLETLFEQGHNQLLKQLSKSLLWWYSMLQKAFKLFLLFSFGFVPLPQKTIARKWPLEMLLRLFVLNASTLQEVLRLIFVSSSGLKLWESYERPSQFLVVARSLFMGCHYAASISHIILKYYFSFPDY